MLSYLKWLNDIRESGRIVKDRTGTGTQRLIGNVFRHDMRKGFPAVTTKKLAWNAMVGELIWFMNGFTNVEKLRDITHGPDSNKWVIWDPNYNKQAKDLGYDGGDLGPVYGKQWRQWSGKDQLQEAINLIKNNPESRRIIVSSWNVTDLDAMALPPCHFAFQFIVEDDYLDLVWYQRSVDSFLGLPFNIASYGLLLSIIADITGKIPRELVGFGADCHIYLDHIEQVDEQLQREPHPLPYLHIEKKIESLDDMVDAKVKDFKLIGYTHHPELKGKMSA